MNASKKFWVTLCLTMLSAMACGGSNPSTRGTTPNQSSTSPSALECLAVSEAFLAQMRLPPPAAGFSLEVQQQAGVARNGRVWFVSTEGGATWVTNIDPTGPEESGLTLPLNDKARNASDVGRDVGPGAPVYGGIDDNHVGAVRSRDCAAQSAS